MTNLSDFYIWMMGSYILILNPAQWCQPAILNSKFPNIPLNNFCFTLRFNQIVFINLIINDNSKKTFICALLICDKCCKIEKHIVVVLTRFYELKMSVVIFTQLLTCILS